MKTFKEFLLNEVAVSKRNVTELIRLYADDGEYGGELTPDSATNIINQWNEVEPYIDLAAAKDYLRNELGLDPEWVKIDLPPNANPKDIFAHARAKEHRETAIHNLTWVPSNATEPAPEPTEDEIKAEIKKTAKVQLDAVLRGAEMSKVRRREAEQKTDDLKAKTHKDTFFLETDCGTVYKPNTHEESRELTNHGNSCAWCTASEDSYIFKDYINKGITLFYFIPKDTPCGKEVIRGNRNSGFYALALYPEGTRRAGGATEGFDEDDHSSSAEEIFDMFKLSEEQQTLILAYAPDYIETLESLMNQAGTSVQQEDNKGGGAYSKNAELEKLYDHLIEAQHSRFAAHNDQPKVLNQIEAFRKQGTLDNTFNSLPTDPSSLLWVINGKYNPGRSKGWEEAFLKILTTHKDLYMWLYGGGSKEKGDEADAKRREFLSKEYQLLKIFNPRANDEFRDPHEDDDIKLKHLAKYIETRMGGSWPGLEKIILNSEGAILNKTMQGAMKSVVYGRKSRWEEYENFMIDHFKELQANPKWKYKGKDAIDRSHEPYLWNGNIEKAQEYNTWVGKSIGHSNWKDYKAFIPETGEHLENIDDWPMEDPPLTAQAKRLVPQAELEAERSDMDEYIDNL